MASCWQVLVRMGRLVGGLCRTVRVRVSARLTLFHVVYYKIFLYDGSTGDKISEIAENGHTGGVFSLSWNADSTQFMTSSADMTVKIWDVATKKAVK